MREPSLAMPTGRQAEPVSAAPSTARTPGEGPRLSIDVETLLWALLLAAGSALRLVRLDALPFTLDESARALEAFRVAQGSVPETWSGDLAAALTSYLFRPLPEGELLARLVPALSGSLLIAALWLFRDVLGRGGALLAAAFLAFSPLAVLISRAALPFSLGAFLSVAMVLSLFAYLREQRISSLFVFAVSLALALSTDAVAITTAIALGAFLALEGARGDSDVGRALDAFRRNPSHWVSVALILAAGLELGLTHFGTSLERAGLAGLTQWADMFALPRDGRAPEYQAALLLAYDWPLALAGAVGFLLLAYRLLARGSEAVSPFQRFLLLWTVIAVLAVALATRREAGQLLILLLPLAFLAGTFLEEAASELDWSLLRSWWPLPLASLGLMAYGVLQLTRWSPGGISPLEQSLLVLALGGAVVLIASAVAVSSRAAAVSATIVAGVLAASFMAHSVLWTGLGDRAELAADVRSSERLGEFRLTLEQLVSERGSAIVAIDPALTQPLAWYLRDDPVAFSDSFNGASILVAAPGSAPEGFIALGQPWRLAQGWYPEDLKFLPLWRWLVYRSPYGNLRNETTLDAQIFLPTP